MQSLTRKQGGEYSPVAQIGRRLLLSGLVLAVLTGVATTAALFTDREELSGNRLSTASLDVSVDAQNPWEEAVDLNFEGMLPGETREGSYRVRNVGEARAKLSQSLMLGEFENDPVTEAECEAEGGQMSEEHCEGNTPQNSFGSEALMTVIVQHLSSDGNELGLELVAVEQALESLSAIPLPELAVSEEAVVTLELALPESLGSVNQADALDLGMTIHAEQG